MAEAAGDADVTITWNAANGGLFRPRKHAPHLYGNAIRIRGAFQIGDEFPGAIVDGTQTVPCKFLVVEATPDAAIMEVHRE